MPSLYLKKGILPPCGRLVNKKRQIRSGVQGARVQDKEVQGFAITERDWEARSSILDLKSGRCVESY